VLFRSAIFAAPSLVAPDLASAVFAPANFAATMMLAICDSRGIEDGGRQAPLSIAAMPAAQETFAPGGAALTELRTAHSTPSTSAQTATMAKNRVSDANARASSVTARTMTMPLCFERTGNIVLLLFSCKQDVVGQFELWRIGLILVRNRTGVLSVFNLAPSLGDS
jgi:hypothetical protein